MIIRFFLILATISCLSSCKSYKNLNQDLIETTNNGYKISRIRKTNVGYIIYAKKGDLRYQIVSTRSTTKNANCSRIKKGGVYNLELEVVHPHPGSVPNLAIVMVYGRIKLPLKKKYHYKIYKAKNLDGLCIINDGL